MSTVEKSPSAPPEKEHSGTIWKHPYMIYIVLTFLLFGLLVGIAGLAMWNDWIPHR